MSPKSLEKRALHQGGGEREQLLMSYSEELRSYLESHKRYPRKALVLGYSGRVVVHLVVRKDGHFKSLKLVEKSPHPSLNQATLATFQALGRFKPLPTALGRESQFLIPIIYSLDGKSLQKGA
ncbi:MAG: energy transducer TonB, partial [Bdellovibrionales bacterium]|nr:energy transducer TonB [Bdellovibrionales bacterium]